MPVKKKTTIKQKQKQSQKVVININNTSTNKRKKRISSNKNQQRQPQQRQPNQHPIILQSPYPPNPPYPFRNNPNYSQPVVHTENKNFTSSFSDLNQRLDDMTRNFNTHASNIQEEMKNIQPNSRRRHNTTPEPEFENQFNQPEFEDQFNQPFNNQTVYGYNNTDNFSIVPAQQDQQQEQYQDLPNINHIMQIPRFNMSNIFQRPIIIPKQSEEEFKSPQLTILGPDPIVSSQQLEIYNPKDDEQIVTTSETLSDKLSILSGDIKYLKNQLKENRNDISLIRKINIKETELRELEIQKRGMSIEQYDELIKFLGKKYESNPKSKLTIEMKRKINAYLSVSNVRLITNAGVKVALTYLQQPSVKTVITKEIRKLNPVKEPLKTKGKTMTMFDLQDIKDSSPKTSNTRKQITL